MDRRGFLAAGSAVLAGLATKGWAAAGAPLFVSAANDGDYATFIVGLDGTGAEVFRIPVPARGHAAAAHPQRAELIAFPRRPGTVAQVIDCTTGRVQAELPAPEGRHFYGHGAFTPDGKWLLTTENDYDAPAGRVGVWDVAAGYRRVDEMTSGGIGPHEILRLRDGRFVVANGGIQTHPAFERAKLNLPNIRPNLTYLHPDGTLAEVVEPPVEMRPNSIRHVAETPDGQVVLAMQWFGNPMQIVPLAAIHRKGDDLRYLPHPETARMQQFADSLAVSGDGHEIAVTGPRGNHVLFYDAATGAAKGSVDLKLASGVAPFGDGVVISRAGGLSVGNSTGLKPAATAWDLVFDNHLVAIPSVCAL
ncbi:DUF1513 domain-containing protein [Chachezhania sediminis]|uniref:DUF1513 domain-containing protein n=1 Tax=Chachezhania sediminis TaxID=2599291 RepID=UPI00131D6446|nr:DUF1513 domain-containing protein [Chachezhania sediminis]